MAKVFAVPEIKGLDELLALVADPARIAAHLAALKEMLDAVNERLGDLDTHAKVQDALQRALDAEATSAKTARRATETLSDAQAQAVLLASAANAKASEAAAKADERASGLDEKARSLAEREMAVQRREESVQREDSRLGHLAKENERRADDLGEREAALAAKVRRVAEAAAEAVA